MSQALATATGSASAHALSLSKEEPCPGLVSYREDDARSTARLHYAPDTRSLDIGFRVLCPLSDRSDPRGRWCPEPVGLRSSQRPVGQRAMEMTPTAGP